MLQVDDTEMNLPDERELVIEFGGMQFNGTLSESYLASRDKDELYPMPYNPNVYPIESHGMTVDIEFKYKPDRQIATFRRIERDPDIDKITVSGGNYSVEDELEFDVTGMPLEKLQALLFYAVGELKNRAP